MTNEEFHAYVRTVVAHMPGWEYRTSANEDKQPVSGSKRTVTELRTAPTIHFGDTSARIYFARDDYRKKFSANADFSRMVNGRNEYLGDHFKASAGFSQGRDAKQVANAVLAKVAETAIKAGAELDKREQDAKDAHAAVRATVAKLNASKVLSRAAHADGFGVLSSAVRLYVKNISCDARVESDGSVRLDRIYVDADTAIRILAILAEANKED